MNFIPILYPKYFLLRKKTVYNGKRLEVYTLFDFQRITYSVPLSSFNSDVLHFLYKQTYFEKNHHQKRFYQENNLNKTFVVVPIFLFIFVSTL